MTKTLSLIAFVVFVLVPIAIFGARQMGLLSGTRPGNLGLHDGMLKPPVLDAWNVVSSYAEKQPHTDYHIIAPIKYTGDAQAAFKKLRGIVMQSATQGGAQGSAHIVTDQDTYLYAEFQTPMLKFTDDVEFVLDAPASVIQMRSASRLGLKDFGTNRKRLEAIRAQFEQK